MTTDDADARLEEAALALEAMAAELRRLKKNDGAKGAKTKVPAETPSSSAGATEVQVGHRVRVVRKDQYRGRVGVVLGRHGRMFWDIRLEANAQHKECTIYKRGTSLCVLGE
jgi:hypothetical protein